MLGSAVSMVRTTFVSYNVESAKQNKRDISAKIDRYSKTDDEIERIDATTVVLTQKGGLSWAECIFEIFFSIQGPFFFILPGAFRELGYLPSIVGTIIISLIYIHIIHTYVWCEREIKRQRKITDKRNIPLEMLIDYAFFGSPTKRRIAKFLKVYWKWEIILSWSLSVSLSELFISQNIQFILSHYGYSATVAQVLLAMFPLTTLIAYIPDLRVMTMIAILSTAVFVANMFLIIYQILMDASPAPTVTAVGDLYQLPTFVATIMLTINFTPLLFQLEEEVKNREDLESTFGSVNVSMFILIALNVCFSLFAYLRYGERTRVNILENLPETTTMIIANMLLTVALMCCNSISFFVVFKTVWCGTLSKYCSASRNVKLYEYFARTITNLFITGMAILVPTLPIFINLTSSFSCPYDSVLLPILLQLMLISTEGKKGTRFYLMLIKAVIFFVLAIVFSLTFFWQFWYEITTYYQLRG